MFSFNLGRWLKSWFRRRKGKPIEKKPRLRLHLEELETRLAPAVSTFTWTGGGGIGDPDWSLAANWGGTAPVANQQGISLFFGTPTAYATVNNLAGLGINAITFTSSNFTLSAAAPADNITLASSALITVQNNLSGESLDLPMTLAGSQQFLKVNPGATLTLTKNGQITGNAASQLTVEGGGTLIVQSSNSGFTGPFVINNDQTTVEAENSNAFGNGAAGNIVTVGNNSQLELLTNPNLPAGPATNINVPNTVQLNGHGTTGVNGALENVQGNNTWSGNIVMENNVELNIFAGSLTVSGVISDTGSGDTLTKLGQGQLILQNADTYRGQTLINQGVLTIENPLALGAVPSAGTTINANPASTVSQGSLQLELLNGATTLTTVPANSQYYILGNPSLPFNAVTNPYIGFVVPNYTLNLAGTGFNGQFSLDNATGDNAWSGPIVLGSAANGNVNVQIEDVAGVQTQLDITGVISDANPANPAQFNKVDNFPLTAQGNLILEPTIQNPSIDQGDTYKLDTLPGGFVSLAQFTGTGTANTYLGATGVGFLNGGTVTLEDSQGLGPTTKAVQNSVGQGSSINLVSNIGHIDSVTGTTNRLLVDAVISLNGPGYNINGQDAGTIHSISGINIWGPNAVWNAANPTKPYDINVTIFLGTIGVEPDPTETGNNNYFANDYSLTITGGIGTGIPLITDPVSNLDNFHYVTKVDAGQLILPTANRYFYGDWEIKQGWITVQDPYSLGGLFNGAGTNLAQGAYFVTTVDSGAALMLRPLYPNTSMSLDTNLILEGDGISHAFGLINDMGAVENLEGVNTLDGNVTLIGQAGIGVEQVDPTILSNLTLTGEIDQAQAPAAFNSVAPPANIAIPNTFAAGGVSQYTQIVDTGSSQGSVVINYSSFVGDDLRVYYGPIGTPGSSLIYDSGIISGTAATPAINFGPGPGTQIEIVVDEGVVGANTTWSYNGTVTVSAAYFTGGLIKLGSQRLVLQDNGTFQGGVDIRQGIVVDENDTALGTPLNTGAPGYTFGTTVEAGAALVLSPTIADENGGLAVGESTWGTSLTLNGSGNSTFGYAPLAILADDNLWSGPITLNSNLAITYQGAALGNRAMPANPIVANFTDAVTGLPTLTGTNPTADVTQTTVGSAAAGLSDVETLTFGGVVTGGTFTLTVWDGTANFTTGNITWVADPNALIQAIQTALNLDPKLFNLGVQNYGVSLVSPIIDVAPDARLTVTGIINDGPNPADLIVSGGGELSLAGTNTYRGTTYVNQGILTIGNSQALGEAAIAGQQSISLTDAVAGTTQFQLYFDPAGGAQVVGTNLTAPIPYTGTAADAAAIQADLAGLTTIGGAANVEVIQENPGNFLVTFPNAPLASTQTLISPTISSNGGVTATSIAAGFEGGTEVADGAQIQLQNGITVADEPLTIQGNGGNLEPTEQTFIVSTTTTGAFSGTYQLNFGVGGGASTGALPYNATAAQIQAALNNLASVGTIGGQVAVNLLSVSAGSNDTQTLFVPSTATNATNFGLTFGPTTYDATAYSTGNIFTGANPYNPASYFVGDTAIANALNLLTNVTEKGGLVDVSGNFTTENGVAGILYTISFAGGLADQAGLPLLQLTNPAPSGPGAAGITMETHTQGTAPSETFEVTYQGSFSGTNQPLLTVPAVTPTTTVSTPALKLAGGSTNTTPDQWFSNSQGTGTVSTAITNTQSYFGLLNAENASGPVTSVAVDPTDANVIYIATAGGGAWRTQDGGVTWQPLFNSQFAGANPAVMFGGQIAIDPSHVGIIYYATGNADGSGTGGGGNLTQDSYYGSGVYMSSNSGATWTLLTDDTNNPLYTVNSSSPNNPLYGTSVSKIIVLDANGNTPQRIAVAASDNDPGTGVDVNGLVGDAGVWYYNQGTWTNTTAGVMPAAVQAAFPGATLPSTDGDYSDLFYNGNTMYLALSENTKLEGVYSVNNFLGAAPGPWNWNTTPTYNMGGNVAAPNSNVVTGLASTAQMWVGMPVSGVGIPLGTTIADVDSSSSITLTNVVGGGAYNLTFSPFGGVATDTIKVSGDINVANPRVFAIETTTGLSAVLESDPGIGIPSWTSVAAPAPISYQANIPNYLASSADYANSLYVVTGGNVYVGGTDAGGGTNFLLDSANSGATWTDLVAGAPSGPQTGIHFVTTNAAGTLFVGSDGGIWKSSGGVWTDLTGNLADAEFNSVATDPNNANIILAGGHGTGLDLSTLGAVGQAVLAGATVGSVNVLNGDSGYSSVSPPSVSFVGGGGSGATATATVNAAGVVTAITVTAPGAGYVSAPEVVITPSGVQTWTQVAGGGNNAIPGDGAQSDGGEVEFVPNDPGVAFFYDGSNLYKTTDDGATWTASAGFSTDEYAAFSVDPNNPQRLVASDTTFPGGLDQWLLGGPASGPATNLGAPAVTYTIAVGIADFQGAYQADPSFLGLTVFPSNHPDPSTIYEAAKIPGGYAVYVTKSGGATWTGNRAPTAAQLSGTAISDLIVDPADRDTAFVVTSGSSGTAGVGHVFETTNAGQSWTDISAGLPDLSVWTIAINPYTNDLYVGTDIGVYKLAGGVGTWQKFGAGLPNVMVTDINVNTNANVLTISTYGRGTFQYYLDDTAANAGSLRALGGNNVWNGSITLVGPTTIGINGSPNLQDGFSGAQLTVLGSIGDATPNALGNTLTKIGGGDLILAGANTYAGVTLVNQGNVVVDNPNALGNAGVAGSEMLYFNSMVPGISQFNLSFNGVSTNPASPLTYQGVGATDAGNIQVALQDDLTTINGIGTVTVTSEGGGAFLIVFTGGLANTPLLATASAANNTLGSSFAEIAGGTVVANGAALELESSLLLEPITVNGNGIQPPFDGHYTGAIDNVSNSNTYTGTITLNTDSTIGVTAGQLTIASVNADGIVDGGTAATAYSLDKEGNGTLVLAGPDSYQGGTTVTVGPLEVQNSGALGAATSSTIVSDGAQLQLSAAIGPTLTGASLTGGGNLTVGATYFYVVTAVSANGDESVVSDQLSVMPLSAGQAASLTWTAPTGTGPFTYNIYRSTLAGNFTNGLVASGIVGTTYTDTSVSTLPGTPGGLKVLGQQLYLTGSGVVNDGALRNVAGNNIWAGKITLASVPAYSTTSSPEGVVAVYVDPGNTLTLSNNINEGPPIAAPVQNVPNPVNASGLALGTYYYVVTAVTPNGESLVSNQTKYISAGTNNQVILTWNQIPGATAYNVYRSTISGNYANTLLTTINSGAITSYTDIGTVTGAGTPNTAAASGLAEIGAGTLVLAGNNSFTGGTYVGYVFGNINDSGAVVPATIGTGGVNGGVIDIQSSTALGSDQGNEIQRIDTFEPPNTTPSNNNSFNLTFNGVPTGNLPFGSSAAVVQAALNGLSSINANGGSVSVTQSTVQTGLDEVQTVSLTNPTSPLNVPTVTGAAAVAGGDLAATMYYYEITAVIPAFGESLPSTQQVVTTSGGNLSASLTWNEVAGATSYKIYRSTVSGDFNQAYLTTFTPTVPAASYTYIDSGPVAVATLAAPTFVPLTNSSIAVGGSIPLATYNYVITAIGPAGESVISTALTAVIASAGTQEVHLSWGVVPLATGYRIYRSTTLNYSNSLIATIGSGATTSFTDVGTVSASFSPPVQTQYTLSFGVTLSGTTATGSKTVTALASTSQLAVGMQVSGNGIPAGTVIAPAGILSGSSVMLSNNANPGAANTALTFTAVTASLNYLGVGGTGPGSDAAAIQAALQALPTIGANNVIVTPDATDTIFTITFVGALSDTPESTISPVAGLGQTGVTTFGSSSVTGLNTTHLAPGMLVSGTGIPTGATIVAVNSLTAITLSAAATATGAAALTFVEPQTSAAGAETTPGDGGLAYVYTVQFNGTPLNSTAQNLLVATSNSNELTVGASQTATGGIGALVYNGAALQVDGDPAESNPSTTTPAISVPAGETLALNGNGFETLTLNSPTLLNPLAGTVDTTFTLQVGSGPYVLGTNLTAPIAYTGTAADAASVQAALNALTDINAGGASVQVFQTNTANAETFTIPFEGTFTGTGAATQITGAVTASAAIFNAPAAVVGGLINATGDNLWQGNVILQSSSTVAAAATTQLTVTGLVQDAPVSAAAFAVEAGTTPDPTTAPAGFTKAGAGVVSLAPATQVINLSNAVSALNAPTISSAVVNGAMGSGSLSTRYFYEVTAIGPNGETVPSAAVQPAATPSSQQVSLTWTNAVGVTATGYRVYRATTLAGPYTLLANIDSGATLTLTDNGSLPAPPIPGSPPTQTQFSLTFLGTAFTAGPIMYTGATALAATILADLQPLLTLHYPNVSAAVTALSANSFTVTYTYTGGGGAAAAAAALAAVPPLTGSIMAGTPGHIAINTNTFSGDVYDNVGVLNIQSAQALGVTTSAVEEIAVNGTSGSFQLTFDGQTTGALQYGLPASGGASPTASVQNALNALPAISSINPNGVTVTQIGINYFVTFNGAGLAEAYQNPISYVKPLSGGIASITVTHPLAGGASNIDVASGATLQMQSGTAAQAFSENSGKYLTIAGLGFNGQGALENLSGTNVWGDTPITLGATAAIGADAGSTLNMDKPITDSFQTPTLQFNNFVANDTYSLSYGGAVTGPLSYSNTPATNVATILAALQSLSSVIPLGGTVSVVNVPATSDYNITFSNTLYGTYAPVLGAIPVTSANGSFGTNTPVTTSNGDGVNKVGAGIMQYNVGNSYTGTTNVVAGTLKLSNTTPTNGFAVTTPGSDFAVQGNLQVGDATLVPQVQTLTLTHFQQLDQFTLTYGATTTAPITYYQNPTYEAAAIQAALNAPTALGANFVSVTATSSTVFVVSMPGLGNTLTTTLITGDDITTGAGTVTNPAITSASAASATPGSAGAPTAQLEASTSATTGQINPASMVTVLNDGLFDLNDMTQAISGLTVTGGVADTGVSATGGGALTVNGPVLINSGGALDLPGAGDTVAINNGLILPGTLTITDGSVNESGSNTSVTVTGVVTMTGGSINLTGSASTMVLDNNSLVATSDATSGEAAITGQGTLSLNSAAPLFTINAGGTQPSDLVVSAVISATGTDTTGALTKTGAGRLELAAENTYSGNTIIDTGDVQVDAVFTLTLPGSFTANVSTFPLSFSDGLAPANPSNPITYTGTTLPTGTAANILAALQNLLAGLGLPTTGIFVNPIGGNPHIFSIAFSVLDGVNLSTTTPGVTVANANDIGNVVLNGSSANTASLSGTGTVGTVTMTPGAFGTINPGINGTAPATPGILNTGNVTFSPSNGVFFVDLNNLSNVHPTPNAGTDYDQLNVNGNVNLNNALLAGAPVGANISDNDTFTIMQATGTITGQLDTDFYGNVMPIMNGGSVFLNGEMFTVNYYAVGANPADLLYANIVLTRAQSSLTFTLASSANPSVYGQDVTFTALATPQHGASFTTANPVVTFNVDSGTYTQAVTITSAVQEVSLAGFHNGDTFTLTYFNGLVAGTTLNIPYTGTPLTDAGSIQTALGNLFTTLGIGGLGNVAVVPVDSTDFTITFTGAAVTTNIYPLLGTTTGGTGTVSLASVATYAPQSSIPIVWAPTNGAPHVITAAYSDDGVFATPPAPPPIDQAVNQNSVSIGLSSPDVVAGSSPVYGQDVNIDALVTPGALANLTGANSPAGTLTFVVDNSITYTPVALTPPVPGTLSARTATQLLPGNLLLTPGVHTVAVSYDNDDPDYAPTTLPTPFTFTYTVLADSTTLAFNPAPVSSFLGQPATFNVVVQPGISSAGSPQGTVNFYNGNPLSGGTLLNQSPIGIDPVLGTASFSTSTLALGAHNIYAVFTSSDSNFTGSTNSSNFIVQKASTQTVINTPLPSASYGAASTFHLQVSENPSITGFFPALAPSGTVTMYAQSGPATTTPGFAIGAAPFAINVASNTGFSVGQLVYITDGTNILIAAVNGAPAGQLTITPTVVIAGSGAAMGPASISTVINVGSGNVSGSGAATITTPATGANSLPIGNIPLIAVYSGDGNFGVSADASQTITVNGAPANVTVTSASPNPGIFTGPITFTASVTSPVAGLPTGAGSFVTFWDVAAANAVTTTSSIFGIPAVGSSVAVNVNFTTGLSNGQFLYIAGGGKAIIVQITAPVAGSPVTVTTVAILAGAAGNTMPTSASVSIAIMLNGTPANLGAPGTTASFTEPASTMPAGLNTIYGSYTDTVDGHYGNGTDTPLANYAVNSAPTTVTWTTPLNPVYGQTETLAVTVTSLGGPIPVTGNVKSSVTFVDVTNPASPVTLGTGFITAGGIASINISTLSAGTHTIKATYSDTNDAFFLTSNATQGGIVVTAAPTTITMLTSSSPGTSGLSTSVPVTYTATVITTNPPSSGAAVNAGTVSFWDVAPATLTTTKSPGFTVTAVGVSTGAIPVNATAGLTVNNFIYITDGTSAIIGKITSFVANTSVTVTTSAILLGSVGGTMNSGASVSSAALLTPSPVTVNAATGKASASATYGTMASIGAHTIWATYTPPTTAPINYLAATPVQITQTVLKDSQVTVGAVTGKYGQPLTYTVTVKSAIGGGVPTGHVVLTFGANTYTSTALVAGGGGATATISVPGGVMNAGTTSLLFTYNNDLAPTNTWVSSATTVSQVISAATTSMGLISSVPGASEVGQPVTFTATLSVPATVPAGTPGLPTNGTVTIKDGANTLQQVTLTGVTSGPVTYNGTTSITVTYTTTTLALSSTGHAITAVYAPGTNFALSNTASLAQPQKVAAAGTLGALTPAASSITTQGATYSATITFTKSTGGTGTIPPGNISVSPGSLPAGLTVFSVSNTTAAAVITISGSPTGTGPSTFTLNVMDSAGATVSKAYTITVNPQASLSTLTATAGFYNTAFTATTTISGGTGPFTLQPVSGGTLPNGLTATLSGTKITITGKPTAAAVATGTFSFNINVKDAAGVVVSTPETITISPATTTVTSLTTSAATVLVGNSVKFTAVVSSVAGAPMPGVVAINDSVLGFLGNATFVSVSGTTATYVLNYTYSNSVQRGARTITATYTGSNPGSPATELFNASATSGPIAQNVVNTLMSLSASTTAPNPNQLVTFTATFTAVGGAAGQVITFSDNGVAFLTTTLSGNGPTYTVTFTKTFAAGSKNVITASFAGDPLLDPAMATVTETAGSTIR